MTTLCIALLDGFEGDPVVVKVNGREVFNQDSVKTKHQIGKAASFEVDLKDGPATVEVSLPSKDLAKTIDLKVSGETYLGISLTENNKIKHNVSLEPFRYA